MITPAFTLLPSWSICKLNRVNIIVTITIVIIDCCQAERDMYLFRCLFNLSVFLIAWDLSRSARSGLVTSFVTLIYHVHDPSLRSATTPVCE